MRFDDRFHAGETLAEAVAELEPDDPIVLGLPRGGVPVGFEVARRLGCLLDVIVVRKVGVPYQPELAMGAVGEGGVVIRNDEVLLRASVSDREFDAAAGHQAALVKLRSAQYRRDVPAVSPDGHVALVVDDGLATGSTAEAAVEVARGAGASEVWVAVPVAPIDTVERIERLADRVVAVHSPADFGAVGFWYADFAQTSDQQVTELLARSRLP